MTSGTLILAPETQVLASNNLILASETQILASETQIQASDTINWSLRPNHGLRDPHPGLFPLNLTYKLPKNGNGTVVHILTFVISSYFSMRV